MTASSIRIGSIAHSATSPARSPAATGRARASSASHAGRGSPMARSPARPQGNARNAIRCALYTRKSTEEGLEQAFNSLDAHREACSAYVLTQRNAVRGLLPHSYIDGVLSGGHIDSQ